MLKRGIVQVCFYVVRVRNKYSLWFDGLRWDKCRRRVDPIFELLFLVNDWLTFIYVLWNYVKENDLKHKKLLKKEETLQKKEIDATFTQPPQKHAGAICNKLMQDLKLWACQKMELRKLWIRKLLQHILVKECWTWFNSWHFCFFVEISIHSLLFSQ